MEFDFEYWMQLMSIQINVKYHKAAMPIIMEYGTEKKIAITMNTGYVQMRLGQMEKLAQMCQMSNSAQKKAHIRINNKVQTITTSEKRRHNQGAHSVCVC